MVGVMQHSYRKNGIEKKFLKPDEYVPFSIQAYAISIIKECQKNDATMKICKGLNNGPVINSTSDGEIAWIYYLTDLYDKLFPSELCPYLPTDADEWKCPKLEEEIQKNKNPIKFDVTELITKYDVDETKDLLREKNVALGLSVLVWDNKYFVPCSANGADDEGAYSPLCKAFDERVACPPSITKVQDDDKCIPMAQPGYTMDGEWFLNTHFEMAGGHGMQIVAYNDNWKTKNGEKGGFVIKNSWHDQIYPWNPSKGQTRGGRGSHSIAYWMGETSLWNERMVCANAHNPDNWLSCTSIASGPTKSIKNRVAQRVVQRLRKNFEEERAANMTNEAAGPVDMCLNSKYINEIVDVMRQPTEFQCNDAERYGCDSQKYRYFLDEITYDENGLATASFVSILKADNKTSGKFVVNQVPPLLVGEAMQPIPEQAERLKNDEDNCGYYWIPYDVLRASTRNGGTWNAEHIEIDWDDSSYLANRDKYPGKDYSLLEKSQKKQKEWHFDGPLPHAKRSQ